MYLTIHVGFGLASVFFLLAYFIRQPKYNIVFMILALLASNCVSEMIWAIYCPGLRSTGLVSSATGFLDFVSYLGAAFSSIIFAKAVIQIGWGKLILVWFGLMILSAAGVTLKMPGKNREI